MLETRAHDDSDNRRHEECERKWVFAARCWQRSRRCEWQPWVFCKHREAAAIPSGLMSRRTRDRPNLMVCPSVRDATVGNAPKLTQNANAESGTNTTSCEVALNFSDGPQLRMPTPHATLLAQWRISERRAIDALTGTFLWSSLISFPMDVHRTRLSLQVNTTSSHQTRAAHNLTRGETYTDCICNACV